MKNSEYCALWRANNKVRIREYDSEYRKSPAGMLSSRRKRWKQQCSKNGITFGLSVGFFKSIPKNCPQCETEFGIEFSTTPSVDRLNPKLGYVEGNVEWICVGCNRKKQNHTYEEMVEFGLRGIARNSRQEQ